MYYGIDLGTTNSVVSYVIEIPSKNFFELETITNTNGEVVTQSVVYFGEGEEPLVGKYALDYYKHEPEKTVRWVKRKMGLDYKYTIENKNLSPQFISACILKELKSYAEKGNLEDNIENVVITVPADFDTSAKQATIDAAKIAGFKDVHLIPEPNAAILNYLYKTIEKDKLNEYFSENEKYMLVFDLGGGTFDLSLSAISIDRDGKLSTRVITSSGNKYIGGINFDRDIMLYVLKKAQKIYPHDANSLSVLLDYAERNEFLSDNEEISSALAQLIRDCEACKEYLSRNKKRTLSFYSHERKVYRVEISQEEFERLLIPYFRKFDVYVSDVLKQCVSKTSTFQSWENLFGVLLVGGSTHIPAIKQYCQDTFGHEPITGQDIYSSVSRGAAIYASILAGKNNMFKDLKTIVPHDFYIRNNDEYFSIFEKGSTEKRKNINYEIPFALDTKAPIEIVQKYYNQEGQEIDILLQTINYSHPFMFTGDTLEINFNINDDLIMSVAAREDCIDDSIEININNNFELTEEMMELEMQKIFELGE